MDTVTMEAAEGNGGRAAVEFFCPMRIPPTTHNDLVAVPMAHGGARILKSQALRDAEARWEAHLAPHAPRRPLEGSLAADVRLCWEADGKHPAGSPKDTKPDLDNLEKTMWDAMERLGFFAKGDQQVASKRVAKLYAEHPGAYVRIEEVGPCSRGCC